MTTFATRESPARGGDSGKGGDSSSGGALGCAVARLSILEAKPLWTDTVRCNTAKTATLKTLATELLQLLH